MGIESYIKEREKYFYPEEDEDSTDEIEEPEDALEEPEDDYGLDFVDDETFPAPVMDVEEIPDNSDPILNADEFMYSNSEPQNYYSRGKGFDLTDNSELYEIIKLVKDLTDRHFYIKNMTWKVNIAHREAEFVFKLRDGDDSNEFFLNGVREFISSEVVRVFGQRYSIDTSYLNDSGHDVMKVVVGMSKEQY